jgi:hypothetical protein
LPRSNPFDRAIRDFREGIASGVVGFAYAVIVEALLKQFLGPYIPIILISGTLFVFGIISTAQTIANQNHWFVFGVAFISWYLDPISLVLGAVLFLAGYVLRNYLHLV